MRRLFRFILAGIVITSSLLLPASAEDISLDAYLDFGSRYSVLGRMPSTSHSVGFTIPRTSATTPITMSTQSSLRSSVSFSPSLLTVTPNDLNSAFGGVAALYVSFYYGVSLSAGSSVDWSFVGSGFSASTWDATWQDGSATAHDASRFSVSAFTPGAAGYNSTGYIVSATANLDDGGYLSTFHLNRPNYSSNYITATALASGGGSLAGIRDLYLYVPSISLVITQSDETLVQLENIADSIIQSNSILSAFYGDVISLLNQLYSRTGDMLEAQNLANQYLSDLVTHVQSIDVSTSNIYNLLSTYLHYLQSISETADDIYAELQAFHSDFISKLDLLISTVQHESDDIQAKMEEIYQQLISWLDTQFSESVDPGFSDANGDLDQGIQDSDVIEQQWTGSLSDAWSDAGINDFSFDASLTTAFMWVSAWWSNLYNALGIYGAVIVVPPLVGVCMYVLGLFRSGALGRGHDGDSKGGSP